MAKNTANRNNVHDFTSGTAWRKPREEGALIELPSGNRAYVRNVDLYVFVKSGKIPDYLTPTIVGAVDKGDAQLPDITTLAQAREYVEFLDAIAEMCFVKPRIVPEPAPGQTLADDEITIDDVEMEDKLALMGLFTLPARHLASFRPIKADDVETVGHSTNNGAPGKRTPESEPVGE